MRTAPWWKLHNNRRRGRRSPLLSHFFVYAEPSRAKSNVANRGVLARCGGCKEEREIPSPFACTAFLAVFCCDFVVLLLWWLFFISAQYSTAKSDFPLGSLLLRIKFDPLFLGVQNLHFLSLPSRFTKICTSQGSSGAPFPGAVRSPSG